LDQDALQNNLHWSTIYGLRQYSSTFLNIRRPA
jgi:hypothetical protein